MADLTLRRPGIYRITHIPSGLIYVGSAVNLHTRWRLHRVNLKAGKHHSKRLQRTWDRDGADAFLFSIIELVSEPKTLTEREQYWLDTLGASDPTKGYNLCKVAGNILGITRSAETIAKLRAAHTGRVMTDQARANMREGWKNRAPATPETRAKISAASKGRIKSAETRRKLSATNKGKIPSKQCIEAARKVSKGKSMPAETKEALRKANIGRPRPDVAHRSRLRHAEARQRKTPRGQLDLFTS